MPFSGRFSVPIVFLLLFSMPYQATATGTWCGVFDKSSDQYLNLRAAPSANYEVVGRVSKSDFLFISTAECRNEFGVGTREFGSAVCARDKAWVFVEGVKSQTDKDIKGWANSKFIRSIACPD